MGKGKGKGKGEKGEKGENRGENAIKCSGEIKKLRKNL